ncbi:MAG: PEP-CTERM motif protein [Candidatus Scalindua rubra]|uniref:PEP-CTERM motif protein n=1 Tax=Candidatus Scalindua rubra TaxID=1872076 RepID=A0A1E3XB92_9BACT|nr:MAG: PEP-CTERM motif protein [Candidatus Scalindua rubra]
MKKAFILLTSFVMVFGFTVSAHAVPIGIGDFSGSETVETFSPGFAASTSPVIHNGVTYSSLGSDSSLISAENNWGGFFSNIPGASQDIAFNDNVAQSLIRIDFSMPVNRVGMLLSTNLVTTWTLTAFDNSFSFLESTTATMPSISNAVFVGLEIVQNIARIEISESFNNNNQISLLDDLRFEATAAEPIPEPTTIALLGIGLAGLGGRYFRRRLKKQTHKV